ncbi:hypothetical protein Mal65_30970 [Crateriforma conspicua]|nr:hypothetical protein Mal65_30970 [Crateriforma conspicua]
MAVTKPRGRIIAAFFQQGWVEVQFRVCLAYHDDPPSGNSQAVDPADGIAGRIEGSVGRLGVADDFPVASRKTPTSVPYNSVPLCLRARSDRDRGRCLSQRREGTEEKRGWGRGGDEVCCLTASGNTPTPAPYNSVPLCLRARPERDHGRSLSRRRGGTERMKERGRAGRSSLLADGQRQHARSCPLQLRAFVPPCEAQTRPQKKTHINAW